MTKDMQLQSEFDLDPEILEDKAFELIREAIGKGIPRLKLGAGDELPAQKIQIRSDETD